jgi:hypothetical protein
MMKGGLQEKIFLVAKMGWLPILFYFTFFWILNFPLMGLFSTHLFADQGDGLQNLWNLWWVHKAITQLHQSPWHTIYLRYPSDMTLLGHTLNPFNGFMALGLLQFFTLTEAYNFIVIFSFVIGGWTAFLLAYYFTRSYGGSLLAGYIFTFSNYHFAHAQGHLNLESLEWIPLFVLCWYRWITKPGVAMALASAFVLFAVILCDYYYFFYSVLIGFLILIWYAFQKDLFFFLRREYLSSLIIFLTAALLTTGPLVISLLRVNRKDPFIGAHQPQEYSLDLLAPFIPGGHWRFAHLTRFYWFKLPGNIDESSVHIGVSVFCLLMLIGIRRHKVPLRDLGLWYFILVFFTVLSLGPVLQVGGTGIPFIKLPYALLEVVFPPIKLSGAPVRMMVITILSAAVICAAGFKALFHGFIGKRRWAGLFLILLFLEYLPKPIPASKLSVPDYVKVLKDLPDTGGIIDTTARPTLALYYQTIHEKPMAFGYASRIPTSVNNKDQKLLQILNDQRYPLLYCDYYIKYLITDTLTNVPEGRLLYQDAKVKLYDLENQCR